MNKQVIIAGAGTGSEQGMTMELVSAIRRADLIIGSERLIRPLEAKGSRVMAEYRADRIAQILEETDAEQILILVTGDQGFYSAADSIRKRLSAYNPVVLPGISSFSRFSAAIGIPYQGACLTSAHGRTLNIASTVRRNRCTFVLTGGNLKELLQTLCEYGYGDREVYTGEDLSYDTEKICHGTAEEMLAGEQDFSGLSLMAVLNPDAVEQVPFGLPDDLFLRARVPMTKREVRAMILSSLQLKADDVVIDIGAGTGSVSIEAALSAYKGTVYAIERKEEAVQLIHENAVKFHADNIRIIKGNAAEVLSGLPEANAYFIGGSGGFLPEILELIRNRAEKRSGREAPRLVISASTLQTLARAQECLNRLGYTNISYTQIQASRSRKLGPYDIMAAENPVYIITAECPAGESTG